MALHTETDIYAAVIDLAKFMARATADFRRDMKPVYGFMLAYETARMAVLVREANVAVAAAKLPYLEEILRQVELIQSTLRMLKEMGKDWLPIKTYEASVPLTVSVAKQATALRNHFAPAPQ